MDGQAERVHQTLEQTLRCILSDRQLAESEWADIIGIFKLSISAAVTSVTGEVLLKLDLGEVPRIPADVVVNRQAAAAQSAAEAFSTTVQEIVEATHE